ncbi:tripartite tricarboxylate transporter TctB family protein [Lachnospiraceae bacterium ASD3451]|uniref:tripartite tricarboxylate transporter TctB family protein n=1 Tax=Diplocloster agilis TaxID=2850323 RepID=UPI001DD01A9D|nr:tripartite tricarboxylate transporter TctB family protein [Diplocloster agilis]MBU9746880.1 tripartite tricarboxylate transporter TctB family protein [Diplocloster agilis]
MEAKKIRSDIVIYALLLLGCAVLYFWITPQQIAVKAAGASDFTPRTFPNLLTMGIAIAAACGLATSAIKYSRFKSKESKTERTSFSRRDAAVLLAPYLTFILIIVYGVLFEKTGYILSTLLVPPVLMLLLGCRKWQLYLAVYGFAALMYVLFRFVLYVPLP